MICSTGAGFLTAVAHASEKPNALAGAKKTLEVQDSSSGEVTRLAADVLVNSAGLQAQEVASSLKGLPAEHVPNCYLARGCYFSLSGGAVFKAMDGHL